MKSVVYAGLRVVQNGWAIAVVGLAAVGCVEGDPIPADVVQRAEGALLEGNRGAGPVAPATTSAPSSSVAPVAVAPVAPSGSVAPVGVNPAVSASGFADNINPPVLPEASELDEAIDDEAIPEDAIPLDEFLRQ